MRIALLFLFFLFSIVSKAQQGWWRAQLQREDGNNIVFTFEWNTEQGKPVWYIHNASEKIKVSNIARKADSVIVQMPVFESEFRLAYKNNKLQGIWKKGGSSGFQSVPFVATPGKDRFTVTNNTPSKNISGRWTALFTDHQTIDNKIADTTVAEFNQQGNRVTGTFLTPSSDYRYLEGVVRNDSLFLSTFDGAHAYSFTAKIDNDKKISGGMYYAGAKSKQAWTAVKNEKAAVPYDETAMSLKPGEDRLNFKFNDLDGNPVSINDDRFKNKVVIVQLMGSWCPNCMDETAFLSQYYNKNKQRGIEVISLAYEYSADIERSKKSLRKFQQAFNVQYPMLITGVAVTDSLRTEKTLPQLTDIKAFPSSIIIDKKGKVRKLDTTFNGPGTGEHYEQYKKEFEATINGLLSES